MINLKNQFIVLEGICCSGKTTYSNLLSKVLHKYNIEVMYNHGAMTYTDIGREFYDVTSKMDTSISSIYYFVDLIINTNNVIRPALLNSNRILIQDRYYDSVTTYTCAYGKFVNENLDIYRIADVLIENNYLVVPDIEVFCIPPYEIIENRMANSKSTKVHDFYRKKPEFLRFVYEELIFRANNTIDPIIVDTNDEKSIFDSQEKILHKLGLIEIF